jgi:23S rRNA (guanine745-N1)-methyltransferase
MPPPLACTVRDCHLPLARKGGAFVCSRGHTYDVARSGYVNLLQPQDRRSLHAGDSREAAEARARLDERGVGRALVENVAARLASLDLCDDAVVVDLGCGPGQMLAALPHGRPTIAIGIDLSTAAATLAARRVPHATIVVANADRRLPLEDRRVDLVLSLHARRNPEECARVLTDDGHLLIAVPAPDDLAELREQVQGRAVSRERGEALVGEHGEHFDVLDHWSVSEKRSLDRAALLDLLRGTYRGERTSSAARVETLDILEVTLSSDLFLFSASAKTRARRGRRQ